MFYKFGGSLAKMEFNPHFYSAISTRKWGATHISIWPYLEAPTWRLPNQALRMQNKLEKILQFL